MRSLANSDRVACVLALDHRDAMRNAYARAGFADATQATMLATKDRIAAALAPSASAILLDPLALESCRPADIGLIVPLEAQGHQPLAGGRLTELSGDFGPADAAAVGADACKLLLYYRADHAETAARQRELLIETAASCRTHGLPLVVEPLVYRLDGEDEAEYARAFGEFVVSAAHDLAHSGAALLKLQFPGDEASCERLTEAAGPLDWTLLGGSDLDGDAFADQLRTACRGGACGFIAGRAIWGGVVSLPDAEQDDWLRRRALPLFEALSEIAHTHARRVR